MVVQREPLKLDSTRGAGGYQDKAVVAKEGNKDLVSESPLMSNVNAVTLLEDKSFRLHRVVLVECFFKFALNTRFDRMSCLSYFF